MTRILFNVGGIAFEDFRFTNAEWPELKKTMPMGQVPLLEVSGRAWTVMSPPRCMRQPEQCP